MGLVCKFGVVSVEWLEVLGCDVLIFSVCGWCELCGNDIVMVLQDLCYVLNLVQFIQMQLEEVLILYQCLSCCVCVEVVKDVIVVVGLDLLVFSCYFGEFFGGMGQWVMIVFVLFNNLKVLIVDELILVFDVCLCNQIFELLVEQCVQWQMVMLLISYDLLLVVVYCDCVLVMYQGRQVDEMLVWVLLSVMYFYICILWICWLSVYIYGQMLLIFDRIQDFMEIVYGDC